MDEISTKSIWNIEKCEWEYPDRYRIYQNCLGFAVHLSERIRRVLTDECVKSSEFVPEALELLKTLEGLVVNAALKTKEEYDADQSS